MTIVYMDAKYYESISVMVWSLRTTHGAVFLNFVENNTHEWLNIDFPMLKVPHTK